MLGRDKGFDDFLIKPFNPLVLQLRVGLNISKVRERVEANALTRLPGNHAIEKIIQSKIDGKGKFSVLYIDIGNFKTFNDRYGFERGDEVIKQTSRLLQATAQTVAEGEEVFVGHVGGDDFVIVLSSDLEEVFARQFIEDFDRILPTYYSEEDQKKGFVRVKNRRGKMESFPLMSCSVAACTNLYYEYRTLGEIAQDAAEVKAFLKTQPGSHYLRDRRAAPEALEEVVTMLKKEIPKKKKKDNEQVHPLGKVLVGAGLLSEEQLDVALKKHFESGQRLGQILIQMNHVSSEDVGRMLEKKLHVSYVSLKKNIPNENCIHLFTPDFIQSHRVVPVEVSQDSMKLAMCDPFDLKTLDAVERITGLKPVPCLALEDEFEFFLETLRMKKKTG